MNARERFPNLASMADARHQLPHIREQVCDALDLIDRQAREIARLNAALFGEHDTGH